MGLLHPSNRLRPPSLKKKGFLKGLTPFGGGDDAATGDPPVALVLYSAQENEIGQWGWRKIRLIRDIFYLER